MSILSDTIIPHAERNGDAEKIVERILALTGEGRWQV